MPMSSVQLADLTVDSFLERLASSDPAPGGGSASALAGAMAAGLAGRIAPIGNTNAVSDAGVAALLAASAFRGAVLNVQINLPYLAEGEPMRVEAPTELARLEELAGMLEASAAAAVDARIGRP